MAEVQEGLAVSLATTLQLSAETIGAYYSQVRNGPTSTIMSSGRVTDELFALQRTLEDTRTLVVNEEGRDSSRFSTLSKQLNTPDGLPRCRTQLEILKTLFEVNDRGSDPTRLCIWPPNEGEVHEALDNLQEFHRLLQVALDAQQGCSQGIDEDTLKDVARPVGHCQVVDTGGMTGIMVDNKGLLSPIDKNSMDSFSPLIDYVKEILSQVPFKDSGICSDTIVANLLKILLRTVEDSPGCLAKHAPEVILPTPFNMKCPIFIKAALTHALRCRYLLETIINLKDEDAVCFLDFLQAIADYASPEDELRSNAVQFIRKLSRKSNRLPRSLSLDGYLKTTGQFAIGGGGSSDVWKGELDGHGQVAIKAMRIFTNDSFMGDKMRKAFFKEAVIWRQLHSPYVVKFYGVSEKVFPLGLISPYMENGDVVEYLKSHPSADRMKLVDETARGLLYLHDNNIIHGDMKGANVLVDDQGRACICDFGLSMIVHRLNLKGVTSATDHAQGSTRWMAPELLYPEKYGLDKFTPTTRSDVYAFACFILEVMTGEVPFYQFPNDAVVISRLLEGLRPDRPTSLQVVDRGLTDALWALIERCWSDRPTERPLVPDVLLQLENIADINSL